MDQPEFSITSSAAVVEASSTVRLSYEPKGSMIEYRAQLRSALREMLPESGLTLVAEYATPNDDFADLENVLLYNVGASHYGHLVADGLTCLRLPSPDDRHHVRYALMRPVENGVFMGEVLAAASLRMPPAGHSAGAWWAAIRTHLERGRLHQYRGEYTITVEVGSAWSISGAVAVLKPMLDGLVSALHVHDGSNPSHIMGPLAVVGDPVSLWNLLHEDECAVLGQRALVRLHGAGIAWNPADELCSGFRVCGTGDAAAVRLTVRTAGKPS